VADPLVFLLAAPSEAATRLSERLHAQGLDCRITGQTAGLPAGGPVVILVAEPSTAMASQALEGRERAGSPLEGIPILALGGEATGLCFDEDLPVESPGALIAARLRTWGRWSALARSRSPGEAGGGAALAIEGIAGRRAFMETLAVEMKRQDRYDAPMGLALADIDSLREINSRYGHRTGDLVIAEVASILKGTVRVSDHVFHRGGDGFAIILTHSTPEATARAVNRLGAFVAGRIIRGQSDGSGPQPLLKITLSFGVACLPEAGVDEPDALVAAAEEDLAARRAGRAGSSLTPGHS
jgi:diguanylate cyclase (GGDEF)-like protein